MKQTYLIQAAKQKSKYETKQTIQGNLDEAIKAYEAFPLKKGEKKRLLDSDIPDRHLKRHLSNGAAVIPVN